MSISASLGRLNRTQLWRRRVRVAGLGLTAPSLDRLLYLWLHRCGFMGGVETRLFRNLLRPGMRVVDVGANVGLYTLLTSRLVGEAGRVYAFEPEPTLFASMRDNCVANQAVNVTPVQCALGDSAGHVRFYRNAFNSGDNRLGGLGWTGEAVEVEVARLDDVLTDRRVDFIKMDVQGYEFAVFRGMDSILASNPRVEIYFEFWPYGLRAAGSDPDEVLEFLCSRAFRIYRPQGTRLAEVNDWKALRGGLRGKKFTNLLASRTRHAGSLLPAA
jgi:FkbM family methyltransferase